MAVEQSTRADWAYAIEGWLLVGTGVMLLRKIYDRQLALYTHPRYLPLIAVTAIVVLLIGASRLWNAGVPSGVARRGIYGLLLTPLILGVLIPARPAGSALIDPRQLTANTGRPYRSSSVLAATDSTRWNLLDWMFARYSLKGEEAAGRPVDVVGFVYHAPADPPAEFRVVRYTLVCCVADRSGASLPVQWSASPSLTNDQWVRVQGSIALRGTEEPRDYLVVATTVTAIAQPKEPYIYP